jgi:hypothetical protein
MTMTKLDWLKLVTINGVRKTRMEHHNPPLPRFAKYLCTWGEVETVKTCKDWKVGEQGITWSEEGEQQVMGGLGSF